MGYYTRYELDTDDGDKSTHEATIESLSDYSYLWEDAIKWYACRGEMMEYSSKFPEVLFTLHGEGEESGDLWVGYYKDGKEQREDAVITYPSFDESKLT